MHMLLVDITQLSFHCGHIIAEDKDGELKTYPEFNYIIL